MNQLIAQRYAKALFELADESYQLKKVESDMELVHQCFLDSKEFQAFVANPIVSFEKQVEILEAIFLKKIEQVTFEFLKLLAQRKRLKYLDLIAVAFKELAQTSQGIVQAKVLAAEPLTSAQIKEMKASLKKRLDKEVELVVAVDEEMLGGFKIQIDDRVFDYSLDHQLKSFKRQVLKG